jgi:hypothetical protein
VSLACGIVMVVIGVSPVRWAREVVLYLMARSIGPGRSFGVACA